MNTAFDRAFAHTLGLEGGFVLLTMRLSCKPPSAIMWIITAFDGAPERPVIDSISPSQFFQRHAAAVGSFDPDDASRVISLCARSSPPAIARRVISVVVDAVQRMLFWATPHIRKKGGERLSPPIAHDYPSRAVEWKLRIIAIVTASFGIGPRTVLAAGGFALAPVSGMSVSPAAFPGNLTQQAAATSDAATAQHFSRKAFSVPAVAAAKPSDPPSVDVTGFAQHKKPSESLSSEIDFLHRVTTKFGMVIDSVNYPV